MARYDKYEPKNGGFRAELAADRAANVTVVGTAGAPVGVGLDVNGRLVAGAGNSGIAGVLILTRAFKARDTVDVMTDGEIVEFGGVPGTAYFIANATGVIGVAGGVGTTYIGHTVEAGRLVVRVGRHRL